MANENQARNEMKVLTAKHLKKGALTHKPTSFNRKEKLKNEISWKGCIGNRRKPWDWKGNCTQTC